MVIVVVAKVRGDGDEGGDSLLRKTDRHVKGPKTMMRRKEKEEEKEKGKGGRSSSKEDQSNISTTAAADHSSNRKKSVHMSDAAARTSTLTLGP